MGSLQRFLSNMNWQSLLVAVISACTALICITVHEVSHGLAAYRLGDPTAKNMGRLSLNPISHIDPFGLLLMITAHVGWAKPVPIDPRYFKHPKRDMALTALAGPASNFLLAWVFMLIFRILYDLLPLTSDFQIYLLAFFLYGAMLSVGLGVFNLFPIPPLDGSKVLFSLFPDKVYATVLRYERYGMLVMLALVWTGILDRPLSFLITAVLRALCLLTGARFSVVSMLLGL